MPYKDKDRRRETARKASLKWYRAHKTEITQTLKARRVNDPEYKARRLRTERASHQKHKVKRNQYNREYSKRHLPERALCARKSRAKTKLEILTHYGKDGFAQCCWNGCAVDDVDMLTIDHVNDDGAAKRKDGTHARGFSFYVQLRMDGYPEGYQTLCANHQLKKEVLRKRRHYSLCALERVA